MTERLHLLPRHRVQLEALLREHLPEVEVWAYGSRVNGESHEGSDLDLVLRGPELEEIDISALGDFTQALHDSTIPFLVEARDWARLPERFHPEIERQYVVVREFTEHRRERVKWLERTWGDLATLEYGKSLRGYREATGPYRVFGTNGPIGWHTEALDDGPSVVVGRKGAYRGVHYSPEPFFAIDTAFYLKPKTDQVFDMRWAYYALLSEDINGLDSGSAIPSTSRDSVYSMPVRVPAPRDQRAIARVLGTLDDRIELNSRMNETLEAIVRTLFRSWFIDFDPVRAKMEGRDPGLPRVIADLFPDSLAGSGEHAAPETWDRGCLADIAELRRRGAVPDRLASDTPYIGLQHMPRESVALTEWGDSRSLASGKSRFRRGEILFGKLRPYFHKVGIAPLDGVCSTDIVVMAPKAPHWWAFVLGLVSSAEFVGWADLTSTGTRMPRTNWKNMSAYGLPLPRPAVVKTYERTVGPLLERILFNVHESRRLAEQRDSLLGELISGSVRVGEFEGAQPRQVRSCDST